MQVRRALSRVKEYEENINASTVTAAAAAPAALPAPALAPPPAPAQLQPAAAAAAAAASALPMDTTAITALLPQKQKRTRRKSPKPPPRRNDRSINSEVYALALQRATSLYDEPAGTDKKVSAETIAKQIRVEYGNIGPSSRTITRYVNEYKLVGLAPLKVGRKSKKNQPATATQNPDHDV